MKDQKLLRPIILIARKRLNTLNTKKDPLQLKLLTVKTNKN